MKFATVLMSLMFAGICAHAQGEAAPAPAAAGSEVKAESAPKAEAAPKKAKHGKKHKKEETK
jgi:hypothetical protein